MKEIPAIVTKRLQLVSMTAVCLRAILEGDYVGAQVAGGFIVPGACSLLRQKWVEQRLRMIEEDPEQHPWMFRAVVQKSDNVMVGYISFHHKAPDPDLVEYSVMAAELGYTIEPPYRKRGYAKECAVAMMEWAYTQHKVGEFILSISPENLPSVKMAESMGFQKISERMDEYDGLEYVYKATIEDVRKAVGSSKGASEQPRIHTPKNIEGNNL